MADLVFGKYEIIRRLAIGGMGEIFLARQIDVVGVDRLIILKSLLPELADQDRFIEQFLDEARVAATLNHPNIVAIHEVGLWEGVYFIAMEYIHGVTVAQLMRQLVKTNQMMPPWVAARVVHDAANALDYAHFARDPNGRALSVVHRDVSPQNIMVREDGFTKVVDFGIARAAIRSTRTATGEIKGKLRYMPPEQITGQPVDGRSDQFSLGVVLWEMCARRRLFKSDDPVAIFREITSTTVPKLAKQVADFSPVLDDILAKMLARNPAERYPRCRDVARDLDRYLSAFSRSIGEPAVADFVKQISGSEIQSVVQDLTPSRSNFLISYRKSTTTETKTQAEHPGRGRRLLAGWRGGLAAAALLALVGGLVALQPWWQLQRTTTSSDAAAVVNALDAATAVVEPARAARLTITTEPSGATVLAGPIVLGTTPLDIDTLAPGVTHTLDVEKRGFQTQDVSVALVAGAARSVALTLTKQAATGKSKTTSSSTRAAATKTPAAAASTELGALTLHTVPWTKVTIDNDPYGSTPIFKVKLAAGQHKVRLVNDQENIDVTKTIEIKPGQVSKFNYDLTVQKNK